MPTISENRISATHALMTDFFRMKTMAASRAAVCCLEAGAATSGPSDFFDFGPAEQAGRHEDQHDNEDREGGDVLVLDRKIGRPEGLDQSDREAAEHGARQRADSAEHRRRECLDAR